MADILNLPNCGGTTGTFNSGIPLCDVIRKAPKALILLDAGLGANLAARASISAFITWLTTASRAVRGSRAYIIKDLTNYEDTSQAATKAAIGNLSISQITMQEGIPSFDFQHRKGDLFHKQLSRAENQNMTMMIVDDANVVYGTYTAGGLFTGFSLSEFKAGLARFATSSTPSNYPFSVVLANLSEYKENLAIIQADATILSVSGINDVDLNTLGAPPVQATNVIKITPVSTGGKNIGVIYPTELASASAWVATNSQTGAGFTITSVAWDSALLRFNVTLDSTAYTALATGDKVSVNLVSPAALKVLGVDGFESLGPVTVTKP